MHRLCFASFATFVSFAGLVACTASHDLGSHDPSLDASAEGEPEPTLPGSNDDAGGSKPPGQTNDGGTKPEGPKTRVWKTRSPMPTPRTRLAAVFTLGKLYTLGGFGSSGATGKVEIYDPIADSWSPGAAMPTPRYGTAAVVRQDGKIVVMGGDPDDETIPSSVGHSNVVEILDPISGTWSPGPSLPEGRYHGAAAVRADGTIVFAGGLNVPANKTREGTFMLAPGANAWVTGPVMTTSRTSHTLVAGADGAVYAMGGTNHDGTVLASIEVLGPTALGFATLPAMPQKRSAHAAALAADGRIYVTGAGGLAKPVLYDPSAKAWSPLPEPPDTIGYAAGAAAPDGTFFLAGGEGGMPLDDLFSLEP